MTPPDVVIIGGGPAGLAAALASRRKGFHVTVLDGARPAIDKACGEGLLPDGLAALRSLGVLLDPARSYPFRGIRLFESGVSVEADFPAGVGLGIRRTTLHQIMVERAAEAGVVMRWATPATRIASAGVYAGGELFRCRWIIGADGGHSQVRRWAGLDACRRDDRRFGYRRHYRMAPWTDYTEVYWGTRGQIYVTPVAPDQVCVALLSGSSHVRLDDALPHFPEVARRVRGATVSTPERGGVCASRRLNAVTRDRIALIGDASGSVDAITGEGLCLAIRQALALADALASDDLAGYQREHRRIFRRPELMAGLLLALDKRTWLRRPALQALAAQPAIFRKLLAVHVGAGLTSGSGDRAAH